MKSNLIIPVYIFKSEVIGKTSIAFSTNVRVNMSETFSGVKSEINGDSFFLNIAVILGSF